MKKIQEWKELAVVLTIVFSLFLFNWLSPYLMGQTLVGETLGYDTNGTIGASSPTTFTNDVRRNSSGTHSNSLVRNHDFSASTNRTQALESRTNQWNLAITNVSTVAGAGEDFVNSVVPTLAYLKKLTSSGPITTTGTSTNITIGFNGAVTFNASGATNIPISALVGNNFLTNLVSVGSGTSLIHQVLAPDGKLKSLVPGANITLTDTPTNITIAVTGGAGEANTGSNQGLGLGWFWQKSGVDLQFRSVTNASGSPITVAYGVSTNILIGFDGSVTFNASGATNLNASSLASGTIPSGVFPNPLPTLSGANLTNLNASALGSGTLPSSVFPNPLPTLSGANLTNLNASALLSGTVPDARLSANVTLYGTLPLTNAFSVGAGTSIVSSVSGSIAHFKSIVPGANITIADTPTNITISSTGGGGGSGDAVSTNDPGYIRVALNDFKSKNTLITNDWTAILPSITAGRNARIQSMRIVNNLGVAVTYDIRVYTGAITNRLEDARTLNVNNWGEYNDIVIENGGFIHAKCSTNIGVYAQLSYVHETNSLASGKCISLGTAATDIIPTVASGKRVRLLSLYIHNTNASAKTFTIDMLDKTSGTTFSIHTNTTINPFQTIRVDNLNFETGGKLTGVGSTANDVEVIASYETRDN